MKKGRTSRPTVIEMSGAKPKRIQLKVLPAASLPRRFLAAAMDWYGSALCANLIITLIASLNQGQLLVTASIAGLSPGPAIAAVCCSSCAVLAYFVMIPMLVPGFEGQTPGKRLAQIRITNREGKPASPAQLGTRALSFLFLEQTFNNAAFLVRTLLTRFLNPGLVQGYYVFGLAASLVSVLLLLKTKRCMLHDKLAGTQVSAAE